MAALTQKLAERIKQAGYTPPRVEGLTQSDWVVVDAGDVIVHLFRPEVREFYNLEKLWMVASPEPASDDSGSDKSSLALAH